MVDVRLLGSMTREEVESAAAESLLVLPIGATEQHGPCLPLSTDTVLVEAVLDLALNRLRGRAEPPISVLVAPTLPYGNSQHHLFACSGSLTSGTLRAVLDDLINSYYASGFRRLIMINGHGGNVDAMRMATQDAVARVPMVLGACSYFTLIDDDAVEERMGTGTEVRELSGQAGHAGLLEASLLLALRPDLLAVETLQRRAEDLTPWAGAVFTESLGPGVLVARSGDWSSSGGFTDGAARATGKLGRAHTEVLGERLADVLAGFASLPLALD